MDLLASIQVGNWGWLDFGLAGATTALLLVVLLIFFAFLFFHNRPRSKPE